MGRVQAESESKLLSISWKDKRLASGLSNTFKQAAWDTRLTHIYLSNLKLHEPPGVSSQHIVLCIQPLEMLWYEIRTTVLHLSVNQWHLYCIAQSELCKCQLSTVLWYSRVLRVPACNAVFTQLHFSRRLLCWAHVCIATIILIWFRHTTLCTLVCHS